MNHPTYNQQETLQVTALCESILSILWNPLYFTMHRLKEFSGYWLS